MSSRQKSPPHRPARRRSRGVPSNIANAVVIKNNDVFFLAEHGGSVPAGNQDGFGLYYHDCRYLNGYEIRIADTRPNPLVSTCDQGSISQFELTNETLHLKGKPVPAQTFGIFIERVIDSAATAVHDVVTIHNYGFLRYDLSLSFSFRCGFEDVFEIRGFHRKESGKQRKAEWKNGVLSFVYDGADKVQRSLETHFDPKPNRTSKIGGEFVLRLGAGESKEIKLSLRIVEAREKKHQPRLTKPRPAPAVNALQQQSREWLAGCAQIQSDNSLLNQVMQRSLLDLRVLQSSLDSKEFFAAGLPWYGALFGRDAIIAALQTLAFEPRIAEQTIRLLGKYQGTKVDEWRDEQPGKILHELRRGEMANLNEVPQTPYYGSVDSTPLFLILIGEHAKWTGDLQLFNDMRGHIERALAWIDSGGDDAGNGYLSYRARSSRGLGNQGWKDSGDAIMNADGTLAVAPISLVEVQGYVYRAKLAIADLYARSGEDDSANRLRRQAAKLRARFNRDFWIASKNYYAIALQRGGRPAAVISSNPGQALWTGIIDHSKAGSVVHHLTAPDMFTGWGLRTLSEKERRFNPIGYHLGTVWPHDNSIIAAGFRRCGFDREAVMVFEGLMRAAGDFEHFRLPELFGGFSDQQFHLPVRYPVACHPQAWASGSVPFLLTELLGLAPDAFHGRLRVVRPVLPQTVRQLDFRRVRVGLGSMDLRFARAKNDDLSAEVLDQSGGICVELEPKSNQRAGRSRQSAG